MKHAPRVEDEALIRSAQEGDRAAFGELVRRNHAWLVRYALYLTGRFAEAQDIAQEAFARAFLKLDSLSSPAAFRAWLRKIATRIAFNRERDRSTRAKYEEQVVPVESSGLEARVAAREALARNLLALPYPYREILVLRYVEELEVKEIASLLEVGESAAKMRLSRARIEFKRIHEGAEQ